MLSATHAETETLVFLCNDSPRWRQKENSETQKLYFALESTRCGDAFGASVSGEREKCYNKNAPGNILFCDLKKKLKWNCSPFVCDERTARDGSYTRDICEKFMLFVFASIACVHFVVSAIPYCIVCVLVCIRQNMSFFFSSSAGCTRKQLLSFWVCLECVLGGSDE